MAVQTYATSAARARVRNVEDLLEAISELAEARHRDRQVDTSRRHERNFVGMIGQWVRAAIDLAPGGARALQYLDGFFAQARATDAIDAERDRDVEAAEMLVKRVAGRLDGLTS